MSNSKKSVANNHPTTLTIHDSIIIVSKNDISVLIYKYNKILNYFILISQIIIIIFIKGWVSLSGIRSDSTTLLLPNPIMNKYDKRLAYDITFNSECLRFNLLLTVIGICCQNVEYGFTHTVVKCCR